MTARALLLAVLASWAPCALAFAQEPASAAEWVTEGMRAEEHAQPRQALAAYRRAVEAAPNSRYAARATTRIAWLEERSADDYAPLTTMLAFQRRPQAERTAAVVEAFASATEAMPAGIVRAESRAAVAGEWSRLGHTDRALRAWQTTLDDPDASDSQRDLIRESMARARMHAGDLDGALAELDDASLRTVSLHRHVEREIRARTWVPVAYAVFGLFVLAVVVLVARSRRASEIVRDAFRQPLRWAIAFVVGLGPFAIVSWWGDDSVMAFQAFAPFSVAIVALSFLAGEATDARAARLLVGALAFAAALAMAYAAVARHGEALPFA